MRSRLLLCCLASTALWLASIAVMQSATFNIVDGDIAGLKTAINVANANNENDVINLAAAGSYVLTAIDNSTNGDNGLPVITADSGHNILLNGNGSQIARDSGGSPPPFRILQIMANATLTLTNLTIANGYINGLGGGTGGGINNSGGALALINCTIRDNSVSATGSQSYAFGGGICSSGNASLIATECLFFNNTVPADGTGYGGAINSSGANGTATVTLTRCTFDTNVSFGVDESLGGAISNDGTGSTAKLTVLDSTFTNNSADVGGALFNDGLSGGFATMTVRNCTVSANSADRGGGIGNRCPGGTATVVISNSTFAGNEATIAGGAIYDTGAGGGTAVVQIGNTILKLGKNGANLFRAAGGTITSQGSNLSDDAAGGDGLTGPGGFLNASGDQRNTDPQLGPLQNNGGLTATHALLVGSPAINAGNASFAPLADQRGYFRAGAVDIGAFEFGGAPLKITLFTRATNGQVTLSGSSIPNSVITIQKASEPNAGSFSGSTPVAVDPSGIWLFQETSATAKQFYRATFP